jgi:signal transduction histidine kinase
MGRRLPLRAVRRTAQRVGVALLAATAVAAIAWPVYGRQAFLDCLKILAPLGVSTAVVAEVLASQRAWLGGLRRQLSAVALLGAVQLAVGVALFANLMFVSRHDAFFMALIAGYAGLVGLAAAALVARRVLADVDAVRGALVQVGEGSRDVQIAVAGGDELATLAADVETMVDKVARAERARRELVAAVSHDLRTPVTTLQLVAEGLEDGVFEPERTREKLGLISTHVRALGALIDDLLEFSRLEAGDVHWSTEHVQLGELLEETVEAMRPQADRGGVAVRAEIAGGTAAAQANPEQLQRVLFNLIQNAIRHTPADGSVVVRAESVAGRAVELEVADTGEGIAEGDRDRVFEPFAQGASRSGRSDGAAGLGLAIARAIVEAHGGRIWLADAQAGTRVRFTLPAS